MLRVIRRWLKAGGLEAGMMEPSEEGVPQGGSMRVVLSPLSLHDGRDLGCERVVKPRLQGEAYLIRDIDDLVGCFQHRSDAHRVQQVGVKRLAQFACALEPSKTRLVAGGRFAERDAQRAGQRRETFTLLGVTLYCTRNHRGHCKVGGKTAKSRLQRRLATFPPLLQPMRHKPRHEPAEQINQGVRGPSASDGIAGHLGRLQRVSRRVERSWRTMRSRRSQTGKGRWEVFVHIKHTSPLQRPKLRLP